MQCNRAPAPPGPAGAEAARINCFALVTYIPDPLGAFLNQLREELAPGCGLHSHISILPPRTLLATAEEAWDQIRAETRRLSPLHIDIGDVAVFQQTSVVYLEIACGRDSLVSMHATLNSGALAFAEPYPYHPHLTLAQEFPLPDVGAIHDLAIRRWREFPHPRTFALDRLTFVQNTAENRWIDLSECRLGSTA